MHRDQSKFVSEVKYAHKSMMKCGVVVVARIYKPMSVIVDGQVVGRIEIICRCRRSRDIGFITDRWVQSCSQGIYAIDMKDNLCYIAWEDIKNGRYSEVKKLDQKVEYFFIANDKITKLLMDGSLILPYEESIDMNSIHKTVKWTNMSSAAKRWVVCGDIDHQTIMESVRSSNTAIHTLTISMPANANAAKSRHEPSIHTLTTIFAEGRRSLMMAIDRHARCHLISAAGDGHLAMIVAGYSVRGYAAGVTCAVQMCDNRGDVILCGHKWMKKVTVLLK